MRKIQPCPPIVPPSFEPSPAARDALDAAESAHEEASEAARAAEDNARSAKVATADAQRAFGDEDSDERWRELEAARRRETSAQLRAERCTDAVATTASDIVKARSRIDAERLEHAQARASTLRLVENMRAPLGRIAVAMAELICARAELEDCEHEHIRAVQALNALTKTVAAPPPSHFSVWLAQYTCGVVALAMGGAPSPISDGIHIGKSGLPEFSTLIAPARRTSFPLSPEAEALLRAIALEALK